MKELWLDCVDWLLNTGVLEQNIRDKLIKPADLAAILRNGVLLCELALKLSPGCIDRQEIFFQYQQNCKSQFMCSKNISLFLQACRIQFGLTELFDGNDLYDLKDFGRVLTVLSQLSHTPHAKQFGFIPFPEILTSRRIFSNDENSIYCNLREEVEELATTSNNLSTNVENCGVGNNTTIDINSNCSHNNSQYDFIGKYRDEKTREELYDTILTQNVPKSALSSTVYANFRPTNERGFCIKELLDTESNYCDALSMIIDNFYNKLRFKLSSEDFDKIFINIKEIYQIHKKFLLKLTPAVLRTLGISEGKNNNNNNSGTITTTKTTTTTTDSDSEKENHQIADVFLISKLQFIIYAHYCAQLKKSLERIEELERTQPDLRKLISDLSKSANQNQFKLQDLLVVPMQRILKYPLLLKQLIKSSTDIYEQARLDSAFEAMNDISNYINEYKRDDEAMDVIVTVKRSVKTPDSYKDFPFFEQGRLKGDAVVKLADYDEGSSKPKNRHIFLFEKIIMVCKPRSNALYDFIRPYILSEYEVVEQEPEPINKTNTLSRKLTANFFDNTSVTLLRKTYFNLARTTTTSTTSTTTTTMNAADSGQQSTIQIIFKSIQQRDEWKKLIREAIDTSNPAKAIAHGHSLLFKSYACGVTCSDCTKLLAGKFYQGYHCSGCNKDFHYKCTQAPICKFQKNNSSQNFSTLSTFSTSTLSGRRKKTASMPCQNNFHAGDLVVSVQTIVNEDPSKLNCNNGDLLEILDSYSNGTVLARQRNFPTKFGIIPVECIIRTSETLRKSAILERTRNSANSLSESANILNNNNNNNIVRDSTTTSKALVSCSIIQECEKKNLNIEEQPWFFGELSREEANQLLNNTENGTFIVRRSVERQGQFVISLRYEGKAKHMLIEVCPETNKVYLHDGRFFDNVLNLINYYRANNLSEGFNNLDTELVGTPLKGNVFRALHHYKGTDSAKYLSLIPGDVVVVLDTAGEQRGWWKGIIGDRVGFFPISFVERVQNPELIEGYTLNHHTGQRQPRHLLLSNSSTIDLNQSLPSRENLNDTNL